MRLFLRPVPVPRALSPAGGSAAGAGAGERAGAVPGSPPRGFSRAVGLHLPRCVLKREPCSPSATGTLPQLRAARAPPRDPGGVLVLFLFPECNLKSHLGSGCASLGPAGPGEEPGQAPTAPRPLHSTRAARGARVSPRRGRTARSSPVLREKGTGGEQHGW